MLKACLTQGFENWLLHGKFCLSQVYFYFYPKQRNYERCLYIKILIRMSKKGEDRSLKNNQELTTEIKF